jgi:hypothetical protein
MKPCKVCSSEFNPRNSLQKVCSVPCARKYAKQQEVDKKRKEAKRTTRQRKEALKTLGEHKKELQTIFNKFIRLRDADKPCISCGRYHQGQWHAGHWLTVGARPNLRYDENNCHKQCAPCNNHLSGNLVNYRINLIEKIGLEEVERLESDQVPKHYSISEINEMKKHYRSLVKELERGAA